MKKLLIITLISFFLLTILNSCALKSDLTITNSYNNSKAINDSLILNRYDYEKEKTYVHLLSEYKDGKEYINLSLNSNGKISSITYIDTMFSVLDTLNGRLLQGSKSHVLLFNKKGRLMIIYSQNNYSYNGYCYFYSKRGKLNAIYLFENDKVVRFVYLRKEKYRDYDFDPSIYWYNNR